MADDTFLGGFDELTLMAVAKLGADNAYGVTIRQTIERDANKQTSIGAVYAALERLERRGFVDARQGPPVAERGGRSKRFYQINGAGIAALNEMEMARRRIGGLQLIGVGV